MFRTLSIFILGLTISVGLQVSTCDADHLTLSISGKTVELDGEILIEAQDKSLFFRQNTGRIWFVQPEMIKAKVDDDKDVEPISKKELGKQLLKELPAGFKIYETKHYVIAYQTEIAYARWVGGLYESRLYPSFERFWEKRKKFKLDDPEYPFAAIVFASRPQYQQFVDKELGPGQNMIAYYNIQTNRVTMFDLTAGQRTPNQKLDSDRKINEVLRSPAAIPMVATIIHEATHQLIFNRGIQTRFAESPLWLNEGIAMYFEAPNLRSRHGWTRPGEIFEQRLLQFRKGLGQRDGENSLKSLISDDVRLRNEDTALDAYAEAWALNHFLLNRKQKEFTAYLKHMAQKKALKEDTPESRLAEFKQFFGDNLTELDADFVKYIRKLK